MRIGLGGGAATIERIIEQAQEAEASGFTTLWYPSAVLGDPLVPIVVAGRATSSIELGTAVLQTYTAHPLLTAARASSVAAAMGRPGFVLGVGPSHDRAVEGVYGLSYAHVGRHTEEYTRVLVTALQGQDVHVDGDDFQVHAGAPVPPAYPVPVLLGALAPRMLRVAGEVADGTITWMANRTALEEHIVPRIRAAASAAGRPAPRIVVGLPVAVHDDVSEAHDDAARQYGFYGQLPNYARILRAGGLERSADACIVGDEESVSAQLRALVDAGATDVWAAVFPVGDDRKASRAAARAAPGSARARRRNGTSTWRRSVVSDVLEVRNEGRLRVLRLNRPDRKNALDRALVAALHRAFREAAADGDVWAIVLTGNGDAFCSGLDFAEPVVSGAPRSDDEEPVVEREHRGHLTVVMCVECEKPILAGVNGVAVGGGVSLAMNADIRIAAPSARFHPGYARIGLSPDLGLTWTLPRAIGYERAMRFLLEQRMVPAAEALELGLVSEVVEHDADLDARLVEYGTMLADVAPIAARQTKRLLLRAEQTPDLGAHLDLEIELVMEALKSEDAAEAMRAMMSREKPTFHGL